MAERVLGIDPGTLRMGYGLLEVIEEDPRLLLYGVLVAPRSRPLGERLFTLYRGLLELVERWQPTALAIEEPYLPRGETTSPRSALAIGQAEAVALMAGASSGVPARMYTPAQVKEGVVGYGRGSKEQVQEMVRLLLGLAIPPQPSDAADALAVALCHLQQRRLARLVEETVR